MLSLPQALGLFVRWVWRVIDPRRSELERALRLLLVRGALQDGRILASELARWACLGSIQEGEILLLGFEEVHCILDLLLVDLLAKLDIVPFVVSPSPLWTILIADEIDAVRCQIRLSVQVPKVLPLVQPGVVGLQDLNERRGVNLRLTTLVEEQAFSVDFQVRHQPVVYL